MADKPADKPTPSRKPAITNVVLFRQDINGVHDHCAMVALVYDDGEGRPTGLIDAHVFCHGGSVLFRTRVQYDPGSDDKPPEKGTWRWPARV